MLRRCLAMLLFGVSWNAFSQEDPVLMRIDGKEVLRSEFEYNYNQDKASLPPAHATPGKYAERFVNFKLKVAVAQAAGLDTLPAFQEEVERCRNRWAEAYLTDSVVAEAVARRRYDRLKELYPAGRVCVSHIFKYLPQNISGYALRDVEARMDSVYEYLRNNPSDEAFDNCLQRFSDEKDPFWVDALQIPVEFEDSVSRLSVGEVSPPFFTPQGIHIVKLLERKPIPSFEEAEEAMLALRAMRRRKMECGAEAQVEKLKKAYRYAPHKAGVDELLKSGKSVRTLFTLDGKEYTGTDFARFAAAYPAGVRRQWDAFVQKTVLDYANARLEQEHPDLARRLQSGRERLLLRHVTEEEVDERASADELGLKAYFEKHRSSYHWKESRFKGVVLHGTGKRIVKQARKFLKTLPEEEWMDAVRLTFNAGDRPQIQAEQGTFAPGDNAYVDERVFKGGDAVPVEAFPFTLLLGEKVKGPDDYHEAGERLLTDYRNHLNRQWTARLRASAKVEINQEVLKTVNNH